MKYAVKIFCLLTLLATGCEKKPVKYNVEFNGQNTFQNLIDITDIGGQRHSGSQGALKTVEFIEEKLRSAGIQFYRKEWEEQCPVGKIVFRNVIARINKTAEKNFILMGTHYDTKRLEHCPSFTGANDGASGTAILLEIAALLAKTQNNLKKNIEIVFFDGEECVFSYSKNDGLHGSKKYLKDLSSNGRLVDCDAVVIIDMLADKNLDAIIPPECDKNLADIFLKTAKQLGFQDKFSRGNIQIIDDHTPFVQNGIPTINIIDFNYGPNNIFWHSSGDKIQNTSRESLEISGNVLLEFFLQLGLF
jgi:Zn-dependent M28 family amino/carboxypeptidase